MTIKVTNVYNLKLTPSQFGQNSIVVNCSQYDSLFRVIQFNLFNGNAVYSIPDGSVVTIRGTKKDNTGFEYECDYSNNVVTFPLQQQITIFPGKVPAELRITNNGEIIGSWNFLFLVEESPLSDETIISETQLPLLEQAIEAAGRLNEAFDDIAEFTDETYPNAVESIQNEGATQVANVTNEGTTQRGLVTSEGTTQIANIEAEGTTQVGNVQAKGTEVLDSIPSDYTELSEEVAELKSSLELNTGFAEYSFTEDKYINTSGTTANVNSPQDASGYRYAVAECVEGDTFTVSGRGSAVAGLWTFIQSDGTIIEKSTTIVLETDIKITAPANSAYLIVNSNRPAKCQKGTPVIDLVKALQTEQAETDEYIDAIKVFDQKGNIFEAKTDAYEGAYYYRSGTNLIKGTNANYNCFIVPVTKNALYTFVTSNIVLLDSDKKPILTGGSWDYEATTQCNSGDAVYFAVSYRLSNVPADGYAISKGASLDYEPYVGGYYAKAVSESDKSTAKKVSGSISSDGSLTVSGRTAVKDGQQIVFKGKFSAFNEIDILFSGSGSTNAVKVDGTNLIITNNTNSTITEAHGLTIANEITVLLELKKSRMYVSVTSMGITFKYDCPWNQTGGVPTETVANANGMAFSDASLSVNYSSANRDIWYFGDSYAQFGTDTRLPYYMIEYGYDENVLFNAVSGGTSTGTVISLSTLLTYGRPSLAVMATGMNDGSDADADTPATNWLNRVQQFITLCESNNVEPVLCTVPTVPSVNNEGKNAWVRSSGYRYIDYASAVGANASGQWYTGMLSSDNVHPSTLGGNALFTQFIADLPEVMG